MKVLNLYAGLGGNRKLWTGCDVTAVELNPAIAMFYADHYPNDTVVIDDAHEYLLNNYERFDRIWLSAPCPTHSRANFWASKTATNRKKYYPDMKLYQEILFLKHWFKGDWVAENVNPYYEPLIKPTIKIERHLFWSNCMIPQFEGAVKNNIFDGNIDLWQKQFGIDITGYNFNERKDKVLRNCVHPELGLHIFKSLTP